METTVPEWSMDSPLQSLLTLFMVYGLEIQNDTITRQSLTFYEIFL